MNPAVLCYQLSYLFCLGAVHSFFLGLEGRTLKKTKSLLQTMYHETLFPTVSNHADRPKNTCTFIIAPSRGLFLTRIVEKYTVLMQYYIIKYIIIYEMVPRYKNLYLGQWPLTDDWEPSLLWPHAASQLFCLTQCWPHPSSSSPLDLTLITPH